MRPVLLFTTRFWLVPILGLCLLGNARLSAGLSGGDDSSGRAKLDALTLKPEPATCGKFGTNVEFVATPSEAARKAKKEEKLVFVLHVSGHFEDPRFT